MKQLFAVLWTVVLATAIAGVLILPAPALAQIPPSSDHSADRLTRPDTGPTVGDFNHGLLTGVTKTCIDTGKCSICEMVQVGVNVGNLILAIAGAVAFFFLAWAAFGFVTARGDEEHIKEARTTIWNALAGVILVLIAWNIVAIILYVLTGNGNPFKDVCGGAGSSKAIDVSGKKTN